MKGLIIISIICCQISLFSQKSGNLQYFYNKVLDQIIQNDGFLLSRNSNLFLFKDEQISKTEIIDLLPTNYRNLIFDTVTTFTFPNDLIIFNQVNIIQLPLDFQTLTKTTKEEYCKIFLSNSIRFNYNDKSGYLIIFEKESMVGFDFPLDSKGIILGWTNQNGMFYNFEYFDNVFEGDPYIRLIDLDK